ncbi:MAG: hypothetical protein ACE5G9_10015 [Nitrospinales bacterium]
MADQEIQLPYFLTKHAKYDEIVDKQNLFIDMVTGEGGFADGSILERYENERDDTYEDRRKLAVYRYYPATFRKIYVSYLHKKNPTRRLSSHARKQDVFARIMDWFDNGTVDLAGRKMNQFMKRIASKTYVRGKYLIGVDMPRGAADNLEEMERKKLFPYLTAYCPSTVWNWEKDHLGKYNWITLRLEKTGFDMETGPPDEPEYQYVVWTSDEWFEYEIDKTGYRLVDRAVHNLGKVPFVDFMFEEHENDSDKGLSLLKPIEGTIRAIYRLLSDAGMAVKFYVFPLLCLPSGQGGVEVELGPKNVLFYNAEMGGKPFTLVFDLEGLRQIDEELRHHIRYMYNALSLISENQTAVREAADTLKEKRADIKNILAEHADQEEQTEFKILEIVLRWLFRVRGEDGVPRVDEDKVEQFLDAVSIDYPDEFDVKSFEDQFNEGFLLINGIDSPVLAGEIEERLVRKYFPNLSNDKMEEIVQEIRENIKRKLVNPQPGARSSSEAPRVRGELHPVRET